MFDGKVYKKQKGKIKHSNQWDYKIFEEGGFEKKREAVKIYNELEIKYSNQWDYKNV